MPAGAAASRKSNMGPSLRWDDGGDGLVAVSSFERKLESMAHAGHRIPRKSKMGPSLRWDDGGDGLVAVSSFQRKLESMARGRRSLSQEQRGSQPALGRR